MQMHFRNIQYLVSAVREVECQPKEIPRIQVNSMECHQHRKLKSRSEVIPDAFKNQSATASGGNFGK